MNLFLSFLLGCLYVAFGYWFVLLCGVLCLRCFARLVDCMFCCCWVFVLCLWCCNFVGCCDLVVVRCWELAGDYNAWCLVLCCWLLVVCGGRATVCFSLCGFIWLII